MKNIKIIIFLLFLFASCRPISADTGIPDQPCSIYFRSDKRLIIAEPLLAGGYGPQKGYTIKGICYQPIPVGQNYDYFNTASDAQKRAIYEKDFSLLQDAGFNTIRTWTEVNQVMLDTAYRHKIKICMGFYIDYKSNLSDSAVRGEIKARFTNYVSSFKSHPAALFWMLGNEQNLTNGNNAGWYSLTNELGAIARALEGAYRHPVAIVEGDLGNIGNAGKSANDANLNNIDLWASNAYRGKSFGNLFSDYKARSNKPFMVSEYGIDAYDASKGQEDEMTQMLWDRAMWQEIALNNDVCVGGTVMNYSDGWWKVMPYLPSGYMGDTAGIGKIEDFPQNNPALGQKCLKFTYSAGTGSSGWAGVYWQSPPDNWGNLGPGLDLSGFIRLRFWAKGERGTEKVEFKVGGIRGAGGALLESADKSLGVVTLNNGWSEYTIDLTGQDLTNVIGGFCWVASASNNPSGCTFYLDKIRFETLNGAKILYVYDDSVYVDMIKEHLSIHDDYGFYFPGSFPDNRANEEWWGLYGRLAFYNLFKPISQDKPVWVVPPVVESALSVSKGLTADKLNDGIMGDKPAYPGGKWWDFIARSYILFDYYIDLEGYYDIQKVKFYWLPSVDSWNFYYSDPLTRNWKLCSAASGRLKPGEMVTEKGIKVYTNKVRIRGYGRNYSGMYEMEVLGKKRLNYMIMPARPM